MARDLIKVKEVAKILKVSERQVWRYVKDKKLKRIKLSTKVIRFSKKDLNQFIKKHKTK